MGEILEKVLLTSLASVVSFESVISFVSSINFFAFCLRLECLSAMSARDWSPRRASVELSELSLLPAFISRPEESCNWFSGLLSGDLRPETWNRIRAKGIR